MITGPDPTAPPGLALPNHGPARPKVKDVLAGQVGQCFLQLPIALLVNAVNGLILTVVLWRAIDARTLLIWLLVLFSTIVARHAVLRAYRDPHRRALRTDSVWRRYCVLGACMAGLAWGSAGIILFHPDSFPHQVFLAFVLGGMLAGGVPLLSSVSMAYPCFAIPVVLPIMFEMLAQGDDIHFTMGMMVLIFGISMLASASRVHQLFRESIELRLELSSTIETSHALAQMVHRDELTGIANRRLFEEVLANEWRRAQRDGVVLAVISADIDHFKAYNDHYGHPAGDRCLKVVAKTMAKAMHRPGDLAARTGGEEFAFLLPGTSLEGAAMIAERIHQHVLDLNWQHEASPVAGRVTVSLGVAASDRIAAATASDLLRASDEALYQAKRRGRNRVVCHAEASSPATTEETGAPARSEGLS